MQILKGLAALFLTALACFAQASAPSPDAKFQFFDQNGLPLAGGQVCSYLASTTTPSVTFADGLATPNANPLILDSSGRGDIWFGPMAYKIIVRTPGVLNNCTDGDILYTKDLVSNAGQVLRADLASIASGKGAALIAFQATGATVPTTLASIFNTAIPFNVLWTGADATGMTDSSAALNAAASSGASAIYLAPGTYTAQNVEPMANQTWSGPGVVKLKANAVATSAHPVFNITASNVVLDSLTCDANEANVVRNTTVNDLWDQPACVVISGGANGTIVKDMTITDSAYFGVVLAESTNTMLSNLNISNVYAGCIRATSDPVGGTNGNSGVQIPNLICKNITKPSADADGPGKGITIAGAEYAFNITSPIIQCPADGATNPSLVCMGIEVFPGTGASVGTFPVGIQIVNPWIFSPWSLSFVGSEGIDVTGGKLLWLYSPLSDLSYTTLNTALGNVQQVEMVSDQHVHISDTTIAVRDSAPGVGIVGNSSCTTCFNNMLDDILLENLEISGPVVGYNLDTGLESSQFPSCAVNSPTTYATAIGSVKIEGGTVKQSRLAGAVLRGAASVSMKHVDISSTLGTYGSCGTTSGVMVGPGLTTFIGDDLTIAAQQISVGDIPTGGSAAGNATNLFLKSSFLDGGFMNLLNANGGAYHIESNFFQEEPGNATAIVETVNDPSVPLWGLNNTFEGHAAASTTGTALITSTALTVASGTGTANGQYIRGAGIEPGTSIASGGGTTSIVLSIATTAALSNTPVTFYAPWTTAFSAATAAPAQGAVILCSNNVPAQTGLYGGTITNISGCGPAVPSGPYAFDNIPPAIAFTGQQVTISDSTTDTWGAAITTGGGGDKVLAQYNGSNWTVLGK